MIPSITYNFISLSTEIDMHFILAKDHQVSPIHFQTNFEAENSKFFKVIKGQIHATILNSKVKGTGHVC